MDLDFPFEQGSGLRVKRDYNAMKKYKELKIFFNKG